MIWYSRTSLMICYCTEDSRLCTGVHGLCRPCEIFWTQATSRQFVRSSSTAVCILCWECASFCLALTLLAWFFSRWAGPQVHLASKSSAHFKATPTMSAASRAFYKPLTTLGPAHFQEPSPSHDTITSALLYTLLQIVSCAEELSGVPRPLRHIMNNPFVGLARMQDYGTAQRHCPSPSCLGGPRFTLLQLRLCSNKVHEKKWWYNWRGWAH